MTQNLPNPDCARARCAEMLHVCNRGGFVYVGNVRKEYLETVFGVVESTTLTGRTRLKQIANRLLPRGAQRYVFIEPSARFVGRNAGLGIVLMAPQFCNNTTRL